MATALNVPETEHTYGDLMLAVKSSELNLVRINVSGHSEEIVLPLFMTRVQLFPKCFVCNKF